MGLMRLWSKGFMTTPQMALWRSSVLSLRAPRQVGDVVGGEVRRGCPCRPGSGREVERRHLRAVGVEDVACRGTSPSKTPTTSRGRFSKVTLSPALRLEARRRLLLLTMTAKTSSAVNQRPATRALSNAGDERLLLVDVSGGRADGRCFVAVGEEELALGGHGVGVGVVVVLARRRRSPRRSRGLSSSVVDAPGIRLSSGCKCWRRGRPPLLVLMCSRGWL